MTATNNQLDLQLALALTPRQNRWPNARNLFDNTNDLVGVAELVVVPDVENKVVILGNGAGLSTIPAWVRLRSRWTQPRDSMPDLPSQAGEQ